MTKKSDPKDEIENIDKPDEKVVDIPEEESGNLANDLDASDSENHGEYVELTSDASNDPSMSPANAPIESISKSSVFPLLLGGFLAATIGFFVARTNVLDSFVPPSWRSNAGELHLLEQIKSTQSQLSGLNGKLSSISDQVSNSIASDAEFDEDVEVRLNGLMKRIADLEKRSVTNGNNATEFSGDFEQLKAVAQRQQEEINALLADTRAAEENSQASANNTLARAAASRIDVAIESGEPFTAALEELEGTGFNDVPKVLRDTAAFGVATLAKLQESFPDAARSALAAVRSDEGGGISAFLKRQLGARSVEPREGLDPDAVLSRVEDAVRTGNLAEALSEVDALPTEAISALSEWLENTKTRLAAKTASEALMQHLSAN